MGSVCKPRCMSGVVTCEVPRLDEPALSRLAHHVGRVLTPGDVVLLVGDLGAGKTTFTRHVAEVLGIEDRVTSPTFTIAHTYATGPEACVRWLMHLDAYRLRSADDLDAVGLFEGLEGSTAAIIEWGDVVADAFDDALTIALSFVDDSTRAVRCTTSTESRWAKRLDAVASIVASGLLDRAVTSAADGTPC